MGESMDLVTAKISTKEFKAKMTPLISVLDDFQIVFSKEGLSVEEMDASGISLIVADISNAEFDDYRYNSKRKRMVVSVEGELLKKVLFIVYADDLTLKVVETKAKVGDMTSIKTELMFEFSEGNAWCSVRQTDENKRKRPTIEYTVKATANTQKLFSLFYNLKRIGERIRIVLTDDGKYFEVGNQRDFRVQIPFSQVGQVDEIRGEGGNAEYGIEWLLLPFTKDMRKTTPLTTLQLGVDVPIKLEFLVGKGVIEYWLAPRIENE